MRILKIVWVISLLLTVLLFIDDIAGVDTENGEGLVIANEGMITGRFSWPLLTFFGAIFLITTFTRITASFITKRK